MPCNRLRGLSFTWWTLAWKQEWALGLKNSCFGFGIGGSWGLINQLAAEKVLGEL